MIGYTKHLLFGWVKINYLTGEILQIYGNKCPLK